MSHVLAGAAFQSPTVMVQEDEGINVADVLSLLTYDSSDESVATVDENGNVSVVSEGTAVITAAVPRGDLNYAPVSASFTLVVAATFPDEYRPTHAMASTRAARVRRLSENPMA